MVRDLGEINPLNEGIVLCDDIKYQRVAPRGVPRHNHCHTGYVGE